MRWRLPVSSSEEDMERTNGKPQRPRICFLATLSAFFWFLIFYFHFGVLSDAPIESPAGLTPLHPNPSHAQQHPSKIDNLPKPHSKPFNTNTNANANGNQETKNYPFLRARC